MIEINLTKLIGTTKTKVPVHRKTGTTLEYRRTGKKPSRTGTGKIDKLPENIKTLILELRRSDIVGVEIKDRIETRIVDDLLTGKLSPNELRVLIKNDVVSKPKELEWQPRDPDKPKPTVDTIPDDDLVYQPYTVNVTPQGLTDWTKKRGVTGKERKTVAQVEKEVDAKWKDKWDDVNAKNSKLEIEIQEIHDKLEANKIDAKNKEKIRDKLRTDLTACQAKLGGK